MKNTYLLTILCLASSSVFAGDTALAGKLAKPTRETMPPEMNQAELEQAVSETQEVGS